MSGLVPLNSDFSNIQQFVPSLFDPSVRSLDTVSSAIRAGQTYCSFADPNSRGLILNSWLAAWQQSQGDSHDPAAYDRCPATDRTIIGVLANYIRANNLDLIMPALSPEGQPAAGTFVATYSNSGYVRFPSRKSGNWQYGIIDSNGIPHNQSQGAVAAFLYNLYHGAHFVIPSAAQDNAGAGYQSFYDSITSTFTTVGANPPTVNSGPWRRNVISSHYGLTGPNGHLLVPNTSGLDYLNIQTDAEPPYNPLICALLVGKTADATYNTFLQLEGWQEHGMGGGWHGADYSAFQQTLWNFGPSAPAHTAKNAAHRSSWPTGTSAPSLRATRTCRTTSAPARIRTGCGPTG